MVATSIRCTTCRLRKIKCDGQAPVCGQCRKSNRPCSGPPPKYRFVKNRQNPEPQPMSSLHFSASLPRKENQDASNGSRTATSSTTSVAPDHTQFLAWPYIDGRISSKHATIIAADLVHRIHVELQDGTESAFARLLQSLPLVIENSPALAAALECVLDTQALLSPVPYHQGNIDLKLYGKALRSLRVAFEDPKHRFEKTTLAAMIVMQRIEALGNFHGGSPHLGPSYSAFHVRGIGKMLSCIGPFPPEDDVLFHALANHAFPILLENVANGEKCFLNSPEWTSIFTQRQKASGIERLLYQILVVMVSFPDLLITFRNQDSKLISDPIVEEQAYTTSNRLRIIGRHLDTLLRYPCEGSAMAVSSLRPTCDISTIRNIDLLHVVIMHAIGCIVVNNMLAGMSSSPAEIADFTWRNVCLSKRLWKLQKSAKHVNIYPTALMLSFESAKFQETKDWIVQTMNELQNRTIENGSRLWTEEDLTCRCLMFTGRKEFVLEERVLNPMDSL